MASSLELARSRTRLASADLDHLQRLVAAWGLMADLSFSDLLLLVPVSRPDPPSGLPEQFVVLGQVRPLTTQTVHRVDLVGETVEAEHRPLAARAWELDEIIEGERLHDDLRVPVRVLCLPVRREGRTVALVVRESAPSVGRHPSELERTYVEVFNRLARMVTTGAFPFPADGRLGDEAPRVGDGVVVLDESGRVEFTSPNAVSALHRLGVHANAEGMRLSEVGLREAVVRNAYARAVPATEEVERGPLVTVVVHCLPLLDAGRVTGGLLLLRDISELRRRDRLLLSKDATIREIHHRVKNNLQTISSLLRLQGRRLPPGDGKRAIEESVRRIRSIALVHETLSHGTGEEVVFDEVVRSLIRTVEESLVSPDQPVRFELAGEAGELSSSAATSLAVVLNELLQNVVDHAYPEARPQEAARVVVELDNDGEWLLVRVTDDGVGLPPGFETDGSGNLGLSIVRTLVASELHGVITFAQGAGPEGRPGTVVELRAPLGRDDHDEPLTGPVPVVT